MTCTTDQSFLERAWELAGTQHGVVARRQLVALGLTRGVIDGARVAGRLHRTRWRAVYAVGRPELSEYGHLMAAVLWAGPGAVLSHESAAALWRIWRYRGGKIHISVPAVRKPRAARGVVVHRRAALRSVTRQRGIPVTTPIQTVFDLAARFERSDVETLINNADARNLVRLPTLREEVVRVGGWPGVRAVRDLLERDSFVLTDTELERMFVPIARAAGLERPRTQVYVNGWRVDFHFPTLGLVVECDSLRYHRTPHEQRRDYERDQAHIAAETPFVRYTHWQIARERDYVIGHLRGVAAKLTRG